MSNSYEETLKLANKLNKQYSPIISANQTAIKYANRLLDLKISAETYLPTSMMQLIARQQSIVNSYAKIFNSDIFQSINRIHAKISLMVNNNDLDEPISNSSELLQSIKESSDCIQLDLNKSKIKAVPTNEITIPTNPKSIDWGFLIMLLLTLINTYMQISSNIDLANSSKSTIEYQNQVTVSLNKIDNCLEQNLHNYSPK